MSMSGSSSAPKSLGQRLVDLLSGGPLWPYLLGALLLGGIIGLGGFTFAFAEGASYLSNDPNSCINCHIMREVFDGWNNGSHKAVAVCNDCHTPHSFVPKWLVKGLNGWNHSVAFTTNNFHEPIRITDLNRTVARDNCIYCHGDMVVAISHEDSESPTDCLRCHSGVGHAN
jgi:cytochrome c nitrite reductase small subunit